MRGRGLRASLALLGCPQVEDAPLFQASPTTVWHVAEGFCDGLGGGDILWEGTEELEVLWKAYYDQICQGLPGIWE